MKFVVVEVREDELKTELHNPVFYLEGSETGGGVKDDTQVLGLGDQEDDASTDRGGKWLEGEFHGEGRWCVFS